MAHFVSLLAIATTLLFIRAMAGECDSYEREKLNEGYYKCVYKDPVGIPTIGVGCNLRKFGARAEIESVGANYDAVLNGSQCLTDSQIETIFNKDMETAKSCVRGWSGYSEISESAQSALDDMSFNMGCATLSTFGRLKSAISEKNYAAAVEDMKESLWCRQVGSRCSRDCDCMR